MNNTSSRIALIALILAMPALLWATRIESLQSISAFATMPNGYFYRAMLLFASWLFIIEGQKFKRTWDVVTGIGMGAILMFDMYVTPWIHNIATGATMLSASISMIYYADKKNRPAAAVLVGVAILFFILGLTTSMHLFLSEMISMACIAVSRARRALFGPNF